MKYVVLLLSLFFAFSCGKDKVIQLPEINGTHISEVHDVSAAYLFYDETQKDSVELNRRNLISTTNWLLNIDKRLTLKQVVPHIKYLQNKKDNSSHKNTLAKNYFTCHDTSKKNLGFIEFTNIVYHLQSSEDYMATISGLNTSENMKSISFNLYGEISIINPNSEPYIVITDENRLKQDLKAMDTIGCTIYLNFNKHLTFQEYISIKSKLTETALDKVKISNREFLHN